MPFGFGGGSGRGRGRRGGGRGVGMGRGMGRRFAPAGPDNCICPACNTIVLHQRGIPCYQTVCPNCGAAMTRQFITPGFVPPAQPAANRSLPEVDPETCTGCEKCVDVCPTGAIEMIEKKAVIHPERCNNCRVCIPACPVSAIQVKG
jgi:formate hydrogenlyase subunit 6/NADH:ubiquinone oxidoreductase subunit I